jgi:hypothetical protein
MKHKYLKHENCKNHYCNICDGGLALCVICGCAEAELPSECPGGKVHSDLRDMIAQGRMDYIDGKYKLIK